MIHVTTRKTVAIAAVKVECSYNGKVDSYKANIAELNKSIGKSGVTRVAVTFVCDLGNFLTVCAE